MELSKHFIIEVPLYKQQVIVFVGKPLSYIREYVTEEVYRQIHDNKLTAEATATSDPDTAEYVVVFNNNPLPSNGTIAHEFLHASSDLCEDVGIKLNTKNQEAIAYVMTHLIDAFHLALTGQKNPEYNYEEVLDEE